MVPCYTYGSMTDNRTNSSFKMPLIPRPQPSQPRSQPESLLFNDILEEKTLALRNAFTEFLQVESYRKFDIEFNNFLTRTKHIIQEGRQTGSDVSRLTHLPQISQTHNRPLLNSYKPQTSMISSNGTISAFKIPETDQLTKNLHSKFTYLPPRLMLSRSDVTNFNSNITPALCKTIVEENHNNSKTTFRNNNINQVKINQSKDPRTVEKYLSMWSVNIKPNKSNTSVLINITGSLLYDDQVTIAEKIHNAGILECTKENNLIKTTNGLYRLIGSIVGGSPNELYRACVEINGIPSTWKSITKQISKSNKNELLNITMESPKIPIKPTKTAINLNSSMTRSGKEYNTYINIENTKNHDVTVNKIKRFKLPEQSRPLLASTPKRPKKQPEFDSSNQSLKNKFHQKVHNKTNGISIVPTRINSVNDSIIVTKKRQSLENNRFN